MKIALVVAVAENGVIGNEGALPWRISNDLKWFKKVTMGKPIVMGRKTFESLPGALPGRDNIVITRSKTWSAPGALRADGVGAALKIADECAGLSGADEVCFIGGGEIFEQILGRAERIYLTRVHAAVGGDAYFSPLAPSEWKETPAGGCEAGSRNAYSCGFFILDRAHRPG